jgi:hypothetical protein
MPKAIPQSELETIHGIVKQLPAGASLEEIHRKLNIESSRRTLQRRLALLVEQGRLVLEGRGRLSYPGGAEPLTFGPGDTLLLPAKLTGTSVKILEDSMWLEVSVPPSPSHP